MNEQIKQIAERLAGLRDALEITPEEMAKVCNLTPEQYMKLESGTVDISVSVLHQISQAYGVELTTLMFGDEPKMSSYFITRKGNPFMVTVHPAPDGTPIYLNSHPGQEYNMVLKGRMLLQINNKELILEEGDSIYFNSELPHGMKALDGEKVSFLAIIL